MACDIHAYIDFDKYYRKDDGPLVRCAAQDVLIGRDYCLFGVMAGVRVDDVAPVVSPRGMPVGMSCAVLDAFTLWITDDEALHDQSGYCSKEQADQWIEYNYSTWIDPGKRITHPDWHTPSWLTLAELEQVQTVYADTWERGRHEYLDAIMAMMKSLDGDKPGRSRLVFWFDN